MSDDPDGPLCDACGVDTKGGALPASSNPDAPPLCSRCAAKSAGITEAQLDERITGADDPRECLVSWWQRHSVPVRLSWWRRWVGQEQTASVLIHHKGVITVTARQLEALGGWDALRAAMIVPLIHAAAVQTDVTVASLSGIVGLQVEEEWRENPYVRTNLLTRSAIDGVKAPQDAFREVVEEYRSHRATGDGLPDVLPLPAEEGPWEARPLRPAGYLDDSTKDDPSGQWCVVQLPANGIERFIGRKDQCIPIRNALNRRVRNTKIAGE